MPGFETMRLPAEPDVAAPDGFQVRILLRLEGGSMIHFELAPSLVSIAVTHRTVDEIWYVLGGHGQMWRGTTPVRPSSKWRRASASASRPAWRFSSAQAVPSL